MFYIFFCSLSLHVHMNECACLQRRKARPTIPAQTLIFICLFSLAGIARSPHDSHHFHLPFFRSRLYSTFFFVSFFLISKDMRSLNNLSFKPHVFTYRMRNKCVFFGARLRIFASVNVHVLHCPIYGDLCANGGQMLHGDRVCLLFLKKKNCCFLVLDGDVFNDRNHLKNEKNFLRRGARFSFREEIQFFRSFSSNAVYRRGQAHRHSYIVFNGRFFFSKFSFK